MAARYVTPYSKSCVMAAPHESTRPGVTHPRSMETSTQPAVSCGPLRSPARPGVAGTWPMTTLVHRARPLGLCRLPVGCKLPLDGGPSDSWLAENQPDGTELSGRKFAVVSNRRASVRWATSALSEHYARAMSLSMPRSSAVWYRPNDV